MAAQFITIDRTDSAATHGARILAVSRKVREIRSELADLIAETFQMFDGVGAEQFTLPKTKFGVATNAEAQIVFDLMNGSLAALNGDAQNANAEELATRIG